MSRTAAVKVTASKEFTAAVAAVVEGHSVPEVLSALATIADSKSMEAREKGDRANVVKLMTLSMKLEDMAKQ